MEKRMIIRFDLETSDREAAFFALYAGLRMYHEQRDAAPHEEGAFSIAAAEAYCRLQELKEQWPNEYAHAEEEYNEVYGKITFSLAKVNISKALQP